MTPEKACCRPLSPFQNTTLITIHYHLLLYRRPVYPSPPQKKTITSQHYDVLERGDVLPLSALTFGSLGSWVNWVVVMLLYDGSVVGWLLLGPFLLPPNPELGAAQAHLLCGSQVQMALVLAPEIPRLLLRPSFRCPPPVTISEKNSLFCSSSNVQYRRLFTYKD